ncbi:MAG: hypothetical protein IPP29_04455 [Bacteroidetes bacterium]|nr:hypothetical protein [Bacteroidota bacterium]
MPVTVIELLPLFVTERELQLELSNLETIKFAGLAPPSISPVSQIKFEVSEVKPTPVLFIFQCLFTLFAGLIPELATSG